jgi:hypothetical protein
MYGHVYMQLRPPQIVNNAQSFPSHPPLHLSFSCIGNRVFSMLVLWCVLISKYRNHFFVSIYDSSGIVLDGNYRKLCACSECVNTQCI